MRSREGEKDKADKHTNKRTHKQTNRPTDKHANRQTDKLRKEVVRNIGIRKSQILLSKGNTKR
jgi:hypothetical protein